LGYPAIGFITVMMGKKAAFIIGPPGAYARVPMDGDPLKQLLSSNGKDTTLAKSPVAATAIAARGPFCTSSTKDVLDAWLTNPSVKAEIENPNWTYVGGSEAYQGWPYWYVYFYR